MEISQFNSDAQTTQILCKSSLSDTSKIEEFRLTPRPENQPSQIVPRGTICAQGAKRAAGPWSLFPSFPPLAIVPRGTIALFSDRLEVVFEAVRGDYAVFDVVVGRDGVAADDGDAELIAPRVC
jgi:hypothetical protein